jgi:hypothetical protein
MKTTNARETRKALVGWFLYDAARKTLVRCADGFGWKMVFDRATRRWVPAGL